MARIQIRTTIDITDTGVRRPEQGTEKEFKQCRNYTTFLQVIGLRSVFTIIQKPTFEKNEWTFIVEIDRDDVYEIRKESDDEGVYEVTVDPLGLLKEDLNQVPILVGLDEVKAIKPPLIKTLGPGPNTFVSILQ